MRKHISSSLQEYLSGGYVHHSKGSSYVDDRMIAHYGRLWNDGEPSCARFPVPQIVNVVEDDVDADQVSDPYNSPAWVNSSWASTPSLPVPQFHYHSSQDSGSSPSTYLHPTNSNQFFVTVPSWSSSSDSSAFSRTSSSMDSPSPSSEAVNPFREGHNTTLSFMESPRLIPLESLRINPHAGEPPKPCARRCR